MYETAEEDESEGEMDGEDNKLCQKGHTQANTGAMAGRIAEITKGIGVPVGSRYAYRFKSGSTIRLTLADTCVEFECLDGVCPQMAIFGVWALWIVSWFGCAHDLGAFSTEMTEAEVHQVIDFVKRLEIPEYQALPMAEFLEVLKSEIVLFWGAFIRGQATKPQ